MTQDGIPLHDVLPDSLNVRVLRKLNTIGYHENWKSQPHSYIFLENYPRLLEVIKDPVLKEFKPLRRRLLESIAWKFNLEDTHDNMMDFLAKSGNLLLGFEHELMAGFFENIVLETAKLEIHEMDIENIEILETLSKEKRFVINMEDYPFKEMNFFKLFLDKIQTEHAETKVMGALELIQTRFIDCLNTLTFIENLSVKNDPNDTMNMKCKVLLERALLFSLEGYKTIWALEKYREMGVLYNDFEILFELSPERKIEIQERMEAIDKNEMLMFIEFHSKIIEHEGMLRELAEKYVENGETDNEVVKAISEFEIYDFGNSKTG